MNTLQSWKRWLVWLLLVAVFSIACFFLSQWQFSRRAEAVSKIASIEANYDQKPVPLEAVANLDSFDVKNEWRPVELTGHFISNKAVLVRNRPFNGAPGFLQVVPFELTGGEIVAVETGWLPTGRNNDAPDLIPVPSTKPVEIIARVRPSEPTMNRNAPDGQIATINIPTLIEKERLSGNVYSAVYARLADSYNNSGTPKVLPKPELNEGNHLSYALQWILFAVMAFGALWWAIKQEVEAKRKLLDPLYKPKARKKVGDADKAAEDSVV